MNEGRITVSLEHLLGICQERLPAVSVAIRAEAGDCGHELAWLFPVDLQSPQVDFLDFVEMWRHSLKVEHDVTGKGRDCRSGENLLPVCLDRLRELEYALRCLSNPPLTSTVGTFQFAQADKVELGQEFLACGDSDSAKCASEALVNVRHEGYAVLCLRFAHAPLIEAAPSALAPTHGFVWLSIELLEAQEVLQYRERPRSALVFDADDFVHPVEDLQFFGREARAAFEQPAIELHLNDYFGMFLRVYSAGHLTVPNEVAVAVEN